MHLLDSYIGFIHARAWENLPYNYTPRVNKLKRSASRSTSWRCGQVDTSTSQALLLTALSPSVFKSPDLMITNRLFSLSCSILQLTPTQRSGLISTLFYVGARVWPTLLYIPPTHPHPMFGLKRSPRPCLVFTVLCWGSTVPRSSFHCSMLEEILQLMDYRKRNK